jgi:Protein of unknown function (DUF3435)
MVSQLRTCGEIHGWPQYFFAHQFRYGGGKLRLNKCGEHPDSDINTTSQMGRHTILEVREEQRMLITKHSDRRAFIDYYYTLSLLAIQDGIVK